VLRVGFFLASRRRHTRLVSDWSSDVCSSDLEMALPWIRAPSVAHGRRPSRGRLAGAQRIDANQRGGRVHAGHIGLALDAEAVARSEERRVGKEWRARGGAGQRKKERRRRETA